MTRSPPPNRRSQNLTSPPRGFLTSILDDDRNAELTLSEALAAAQLEHDRVREAARRVFEKHEHDERCKQLREAEKKEQDRLQREAQIAAEELKLRELRAKSIPKPPPEPEPKPEPKPAPAPAPAPQPKASQEPESQKAEPSREPVKLKEAEAAAKSPLSSAQETKPAASGVETASKSSPFATIGKPSPQQGANPFAQTNGAVPSPPTKTTASPAPAPQPAAATPAKPAGIKQSPANKDAARYGHIHQELKNLRKNLTAESKKPGNPLKGQLGNYRREIRVSIGQLTSEKGANKVPVCHIHVEVRPMLTH